MIWISLAVNMLVLVPVCGSILLGAGWTRSAYGENSPARGILLAIYAAILVVSAGLGLALLVAPSPRWIDMASALFVVQILYKIATPFTVGSMRNPVVLSNLAIALVHLVTVATIWTQG